MRETGIIAKHQHHWIATKPPCLSNALFSSIDFASTMGSIAILISGYSIAIFVLFMELVYFHISKNLNFALFEHQIPSVISN